MTPGTIDERIGQQIRSRRVRLGLSVKQLAQAIRVSAVVIDEYEAGVRRVSPSGLVQLASVLLAPVSSLFREDGSETERSPDGEQAGREPH